MLFMVTWSEEMFVHVRTEPLFDTFSVIYQSLSRKQTLSEKGTMPGPLRGNTSIRLDEVLQVLWMMRWDSLTKDDCLRREACGGVVVEGKSRTD